MGFEAFGYDIDPAAVALANANAKLAGVETVSYTHLDVYKRQAR